MSCFTAGKRTRLLALLLGAAALSPVAEAADVVHANSTSAANLGTAWTGGVVPTSTDVAVWNSTVTAANTTLLGADASWQGIKIVSPGGAVILNHAAGQTLTLGSAGIDMSAATQNLTLLSTANTTGTLAIAANQTWTIATGRTLTLFGTSNSANQRLSGSGNITLAGGGVVNLNVGDLGSTTFASGNGNDTYSGNWTVTGGTKIISLRNGTHAWGTGTITLNNGIISQNSGNWSFSNAITVGAGGGVIASDSSAPSGTNAPSRSMNLTGTLSGSGALTFRALANSMIKAGYNTAEGFILTGNNSYSGAITIESTAIVRIGGDATTTMNSTAAGTLGSLASSVTITNNGILGFGWTDTHEVANAISGSGIVRLGNVGGVLPATQFVTLSGASTYTGATQVNAGRLNLTGSLTSAITVASGAKISGTGSTTGLLTLSSGGQLWLAGGATTTSLTVNGATFAGSNFAHFDATPVAGTTYTLFNYGAGAVTTPANLVVSWRGTTTNDTVNKRYTFTAGAAGTVRTWSGTNATWSIGTAGLFAEGDTAFYNSDAVVFNNPAAVSTVTLSGRLYASSVTVDNSTNAYTFTGTAGVSDITGAGTLAKSGTGTLSIATTQSYTGGTTINAGVLDLTGGGGAAGTLRGTVTVNANGTLRLSTADALGYNTDATRTSTLNLTGGTLALNTTSNQTLGSATVNLTGGAITGIAGSNLDFFGGSSALNSLSSSTTSVISGATLALNRQGATTVTVAAGTTSSGVDLQIDSVIRDSAGGDSAGALTKAGAGWLKLTGTNTSTHALVIAAGTLEVGGAGSLGSGSYAAGISNSGTLVFSTSANQTLSGVVTGAGSLTKSGNGVLTLAAANDFTGGTTLSAGTLAVTGSVGAVSAASGSTLRVTGSAGAVSLASGSTMRGTGAVGATTVSDGTATLVAGDGVSGTLSLASLAFSGAANLNLGNLGGYTGSNVAFAVAGDLTFSGAPGSVALTVANGAVGVGTYHLISHANTLADISALSITGVTLNGRLSGGLVNNAGFVDYVVNGDSPVWTGANSALVSGGSNWKLITGGTATDYQDADILLFDDSATGTTTVDVSVDITPASVTFANVTKDYTVSGTNAMYGVLNKTGAGNLTLDNVNAFTSSTISAGTVTLGAAAALGSSSTVTLNGGVINLNGQSIANAIVLGGGTLAGTGSVSGVISGSGALTKSDAGTLTLTGQNTFTGGTSLANGVLVLGHATDTLADTGAVTVTGGELSLGANSDTVGALTVSGGAVTGTTGALSASSVSVNNTTGTVSISAILAGSGSLAKSGAGTLALAAANTYAGGTSLTGGVLSFANGSLGSSGAITVNGGTLQWATGNTQDISARLTLAAGGAATLDTNGNNVTLATAFGGSASSSLTKVGAGTLTVSGAATYTGGTVISAGRVDMAGTGTVGTLGSGSINLAGGELGLAGAPTGTRTISNTFLGSGRIIKATTVRHTISGNNSGAVLDWVWTNNINDPAGTTGGLGFSTANAVGGAGSRIVVDAGSTGSAYFASGATSGVNISIATGGTFTWNGGSSNTTTLTGVISGGGTFGKVSGELLILTGVNTHTGNISLAAGTIQLAGSGQLGSGSYAGTIANAGTLNISSTANQTLSGVISGAGALTKANTGTLTLTANNTFTGNTTVSGGTLKVAAGAYLYNGAYTNAPSVTVSTGGTLELDSFAYGAAGGLGQLADYSARRVLSGGTINIVGSTHASGNDFQVANGSTGTFNMATAGQTLTLSGNANDNILLGGALTVGGAGNIVVSEVVGDNTGAGSITKTGNGILSLAAVNTYTGGTTLSAGTLQAGNDTAFGAGALALNGGALSSDGTTARTLANTVTVGGNITLGHATNNGALTLAGTVNLGGANRVVTAASAVTLSGVVSNGGLTKAGNGTLTLSAANTYVGGTTVNGGTLALGAAERLEDTGAVTINTGGTLDLGGFAETAGAVTLAGGIVANGTLTASGVTLQSGTLAATLAGAGALTKATAGVATLSGNNTGFTGATSVTEGTLSVTGNLSGSAISVANGATLRGTGTAGTVTVAAGARIQAGVDGAGSLALAGLTVADGIAANLDIANVANYGPAAALDLGALSLGSGASLAIGLSGSYVAGTYKLLAYTGTALSASDLSVTTVGLGSRFSGTLDLTTAGQVLYTLEGSKVHWLGTAGQWSATNNWSALSGGVWSPTSFLASDEVVFNDDGGLTAIDVDVDVSPTSVEFTNVTKDYTLGGAKGILAGTFAKTGAGGVTINNSNAFASSTIAAGTVTLGVADALGATAGITLTGGALDLNGQSIANTIVLGGGSLRGAGTVSGVISGAGALGKSDAGTLTLAARNTFTGGTTVANGVLVLGHATDTLADSGAVAVTGGELSLGSNSDTVGAVTLAAGSITGTGTLTVASLTASNAGDVTVSANLAGAGATLAKSGAGTLTLAGTASHTGLTSVSNGTLNFGSGTHTIGALALSGGAVTGTGSLTVTSVSATNAGAAALSANLAGSGTLSKSGAGTLALTGANTYSGGTTVTGGAISFATGALGSTGNVTLNGGALQWATGNTTDLSGRLVMIGGGSATLDTNGNDLSFASAIGSSTGAALVKTGNGKLTLATTATYTGYTTVSAGTLQIGTGLADGGIGGSSTALVTVASGATLRFLRTGTLDYKTTARMRAVAGAGDIVIDGGVKFFNYTGSGLGLDEAGSWVNFSGRLYVLGGSEFQTIRNGRTAMGSAQVILGDATSSGILSQIEGNWTWTNNIELAGAANIIRNNSAAGPRSLKIQGVLSGAGNVTFADSTGAMSSADLGMILTGTNTLTGQITVDTFVRVGGLGGDATGTGAGANGDLGSAAVQINAGKTLTFTRNNALVIGNTLSGAGKVQVGSTAANLSGAATQSLTLSGVNTYTGGTDVLLGSLTVNALSGLGAYAAGNEGYLAVKNGASFTYAGASASTARNLYLDSGAATINVTDAGATLRWTDAVSVKGGTAGGLITKGGAGTLELDGAITAGGLTAVRVSAGTLRLNGTNTYAGATTVDAGATLDIAGAGSLLSTTAITLDGALQFSTSSNQSLATALTGSGSLLMAGSGTLSLDADNTAFAGTVAVSGGTLLVGHVAGLGTGVASVVTGGTLDLASRAVTNSIALNGGTLANYGSWTGAIVVNSAGVSGGSVQSALTTYGRDSVTVVAGGQLSLSGLTKAVIVNGGALTGDLSVYAGDLTVRSAVSFASTAPAGKVILDGGSIAYGDRAVASTLHYRSGTLTGAGGYTGDLLADAASVNLVAGTLGAGRVVVGAGTAVSIGAGFANAIRLDGGAIVGSTLNAYQGTLTVAAGRTLDLDGPLSNLAVNNGLANISLESGAILQGTAAVGAVTVQAGGILAPGNSPGTITAESMTLNAGSFQFEVASLRDFFGDVPAAGTDYDTVVVNGLLDLSNLSSTSRFQLKLISLAADGTIGTPASWDPTVGFELTLFKYALLDLGENAAVGLVFNIDATDFRDADLLAVPANHFSVYNNTGAGEIRLVYSTVPEPSTYGLMLGGLALAAAAYRRRRLKTKD